jgi:hypothetical protein
MQEKFMEKKANEEGGIDATKTSDYGKVYMDQHIKTLEVMMGCLNQPPQGPFNYKDVC